MKKTSVLGLCLLALGVSLPLLANAQVYYGGGYQSSMTYGYGPYSYNDMNGMYYYSYSETPQSVLHPYYTLAVPSYSYQTRGYMPMASYDYGNNSSYY